VIVRSRSSDTHSSGELVKPPGVGGLPLPKVLKNVTNHMFLVLHRLLQEASALGLRFSHDKGVCNMKIQPEGDMDERRSYG
jgi:hypothetical protein